jgi:hypothetical protein
MTEFDMVLTQRFIREYQAASRVEKVKLLAQYCQLTTVSRNTAVQRLRRAGKRLLPFKGAPPLTHQSRGRPRQYGELHIGLLRQCWQLAGKICAERLHPELSTYIAALISSSQWADYRDQDIALIRSCSLATAKRMMTNLPRVHTRSTGQGSSEILRQVSLQPRFGQFAHRLGYIGIDYVEHNGGSASGRFVITGTYTELASGWTIRVAGWGKNLASLAGIHREARAKLPMAARRLHSDNAPGTFRCLLEQLEGADPLTRLSRSRPYHKNDNAHVEQKNGDKVRKLVGYFRLDTEAACQVLNQLYAVEDLISNYFVASTKLIRKEYDRHGKLVRKLYDQPKTPYQRLLDHPKTNAKTKRAVIAVRRSLNLVDLRAKSDRLKHELTNHYRRMTEL